jgi:nucleotide-binding universal stress UspA family protein
MSTSDEVGREQVVLVGLDGSPAGAGALKWATAHCRDTGARLVAVHVLTYDQELFTDLPPTGMTNWRRRADQELHGSWTEPARAAGIPVRTDLVEDSSTANGILAAADRHGATLVVVGVHGHGNLADRLLGATSYRLAHRSTVPVVIVPPAGDPGAR